MFEQSHHWRLFYFPFCARPVSRKSLYLLLKSPDFFEAYSRDLDYSLIVTLTIWRSTRKRNNLLLRRASDLQGEQSVRLSPAAWHSTCSRCCVCSRPHGWTVVTTRNLRQCTANHNIREKPGQKQCTSVFFPQSVANLFQLLLHIKKLTSLKYAWRIHCRRSRRLCQGRSGRCCC